MEVNNIEYIKLEKINKEEFHQNVKEQLEEIKYNIIWSNLMFEMAFSRKYWKGVYYYSISQIY